MGFWHELTDLMARDRPRRRLRDHRRRRGRHRRRAADLHRLGVAALPARLRPGLLGVRPRAGCTSRSCSSAAGKLGLPDNAVVAFALGCDMVNVAREAMLAIGCIQAQKCHTDTCPTGVATQNAWLAHGLDPALKSVRAANYVTHAAPRPAQGGRGVRRRAPGPDRHRLGGGAHRPDGVPAAARGLRATSRAGGCPSAADREEIVRIMTAEAPQGGSAPPSPDAVG